MAKRKKAKHGGGDKCPKGKIEFKPSGEKAVSFSRKGCKYRGKGSTMPKSAQFKAARTALVNAAKNCKRSTKPKTRKDYFGPGKYRNCLSDAMKARWN